MYKVILETIIHSNVYIYLYSIIIFDNLNENTLVCSLELWTHISEVECDLQVTPKVFTELWVHVQHLLNILPLDLVEVTVGQSSHVSIGLAWSGVEVDGLTKDVILP